MYNEPLRRSGRTTEMMNTAFNLSLEGYRVFIVVHNQEFIYHLQSSFKCTENMKFCTFDLKKDYREISAGVGEAIVLLDHLVMEKFLNCEQSGYTKFSIYGFIRFIDIQRAINSIVEKYENILKIIGNK